MPERENEERRKKERIINCEHLHYYAFQRTADQHKLKQQKQKAKLRLHNHRNDIIFKINMFYIQNDK